MLKHRRIASADASMSASVVDQFETEIRMAVMPRHAVWPSQQTPSACTLRMISAVRESASTPSLVPNRTKT